MNTYEPPQRIDGESDADYGKRRDADYAAWQKSNDPNNEPTGVRETVNGQKDTALAKAGEDQPYVGDQARHLDPNDPNAPKSVGAGRSDYSFGTKPPRFADETDEQYNARIAAIQDGGQRSQMSADERAKAAEQHPDQLNDEATEKQQQKSVEMLAYERVKDAVTEVHGAIERTFMDGSNARMSVAGSSVRAKLDSILEELRAAI